MFTENVLFCPAHAYKLYLIELCTVYVSKNVRYDKKKDVDSEESVDYTIEDSPESKLNGISYVLI